MTRQLVLLRHGRTAFNATRRFQGQRDEPLDETGREQARVVGRELAGWQPTSVVSSDLSRARETAATVADAAGLPVTTDPRLREIHMGAWQGLGAEEAQARFPAEFAAWKRGEDIPRGGGETYAEVASRAVPAVLEALASAPGAGPVLAVTHGGTIRAVVAALICLPEGRWAALGPVGNVRWSILQDERGSRGWRLLAHNAGHAAERRPPGR